MTEIQKNKLWVDLSRVSAIEEGINGMTVLHVDGRSFTWNMSIQMAFQAVERVKRNSAINTPTP